MAKFDELNALADEYDDLAVVGVNANDPDEYPDDSFERMQELVDDGTIDYDAYLFDATQAVAAGYGARCTPDPSCSPMTARGLRGSLPRPPRRRDEPRRRTHRARDESSRRDSAGG